MSAVELAVGIPTPVDETGWPARAYLGSTGDGWQAYFALEGVRREYVGPIFPPGKRGLDHALELVRALNARGADAAVRSLELTPSSPSAGDKRKEASNSPFAGAGGPD